MAIIHRQFCDWCGKEMGPNKYLQGFNMFYVKKKYYVYEGYICEDCKNELMSFVKSKKKRGDAR